MGHKNTPALKVQVQDSLNSKLAIGQSRQAGKLDGTAPDKIYSWGTYRTYLKHCCYFVGWCRMEHKCKTLEQCRPYAAEWIAHQQETGKSAYTLKMEVSALAKLYGVTTSQFGRQGAGMGISTPSRSRAQIKRSRGAKVRDAHFNPQKNSQFVEFCRATGLRRHELEMLTGDALAVDAAGNYMLHLTKGTKGGRPRFVPIIGTPETVAYIVLQMQVAGRGRVWPKVPVAADIHGYRADYAKAVYAANARPLAECKASGAVYWCRGDKKGQWYDKEAMRIASQALGHNRLDVIAKHYL